MCKNYEKFIGYVEKIHDNFELKIARNVRKVSVKNVENSEKKLRKINETWRQMQKNFRKISEIHEKTHVWTRSASKTKEVWGKNKETEENLTQIC